MGKFDMAKAVTDRIIELLETEGVIPWEKPWIGGAGAWSRATGKPYALINQFMLDAGEYATMTQINAEGGKVKKGTKAKYVWEFYYKKVEETDEDTGEITAKYLPRQKYTRVFNIAEDTDLEVKHEKALPPSGGVFTVAMLETVKNNYIERSGVSFDADTRASAYYVPNRDSVYVPKIDQFERAEEYYSTVFHELAHSTGHERRLNRFDCNTSLAFGSGDYSREELVAEITACAVLANYGFETSESFRNNAAYIQAWVRALKEDSKAIIKASAKAEQAFFMLLGTENPRGAVFEPNDNDVDESAE